SLGALPAVGRTDVGTEFLPAQRAPDSCRRAACGGLHRRLTLSTYARRRTTRNDLSRHGASRYAHSSCAAVTFSLCGFPDLDPPMTADLSIGREEATVATHSHTPGPAAGTVAFHATPDRARLILRGELDMVMKAELLDAVHEAVLHDVPVEVDVRD